jgi:hypothetical protein
MYEAEVITAAEEKALLQNWFDTVHFDVEDEGIPALDPEEDDEGRALVSDDVEYREDFLPDYEDEDLSTVDFDDLMEELRRREPDNPF